MAAPAGRLTGGRQFNSPWAASTYDNYVDGEYTNSRFTAPVNAIFNYQTADIRAEINEVGPTASIAAEARGLKELVARHSNEVFDFIGADLSGSVAEAIFRRFGLDTRPINHQYRVGSVTESLALDSSIEGIVGEIERGYALAVTSADASGAKCQDISGAGSTDSKGQSLSGFTTGTLSGFTTGLQWLIAEYKRAGEAVSRREILINQKLVELDLVTKKVGMFSSLPQNGASGPLTTAFEAYIDAAFKEAGIPVLYDELVQSYKKWCILRELVSAPIMFGEKGAGSDSICSICLIESITHCVSPCGHTFCSACIRKMNTACYLCRGAIRDRVRLFFN